MKQSIKKDKETREELKKYDFELEVVCGGEGGGEIITSVESRNYKYYTEKGKDRREMIVIWYEN